MAICMICGEEITTKNDTAEHIIPNAIGGRRTVKGFICRECNSTTGATWDAEVARQLHALSILIGVSRDSGDTPPMRVVTNANEQLTIARDGKLSFSKPAIRKTPMDGGKMSIHIKARSEGEARTILEGMKKKYPDIDIDDALSRMNVNEIYANGLVNHNLSFGGEVSGRSVVKSCLALAFASGVDWSTCKLGVEYVRNRSAEACFGYFNERDLVTGRTDGLPLNCVAVTADGVHGLVLGYAEYFGIHRIVACLADDYDGPSKLSGYGIDPRSGEQVEISVELQFNRKDIQEIYDYQRVSHENYKLSIEAVLGQIIERQHDDELSRVVSRAVHKGLEASGAVYGEVLTEAQIQKLASAAIADMTPFLASRIRRPR